MILYSQKFSNKPGSRSAELIRTGAGWSLIRTGLNRAMDEATHTTFKKAMIAAQRWVDGDRR